MQAKKHTHYTRGNNHKKDQKPGWKVHITLPQRWKIQRSSMQGHEQRKKTNKQNTALSHLCRLKGVGKGVLIGIPRLVPPPGSPSPSDRSPQPKRHKSTGRWGASSLQEYRTFPAFATHYLCLQLSCSKRIKCLLSCNPARWIIRAEAKAPSEALLTPCVF